MKKSRLSSARGKPDGKTGENSSSQPAAVKNVSLQYDPVKSRVGNTPVAATGTGADWTKLYDDLHSAIQVRHYSPKTLSSYRSWIRQFQTFVKSKDPSLIGVDDVKAFLTWLAVERHVSASSQNLAFNSLLFFFRNVLGKEFGKIEGVVRAKKRSHIPVVLDRAEVDQIVAKLSHPYSLIVKLLYGCGLRLFECLQLRIQCFNFSAGVLTIHDGKGQKDRTVPIPEILVPE
ncbi:phage integrase N-terminal SAM-like domain-containing protein, partial [Desulfogranum japonicum]|uniref:phage integrase N-terminal SAM-like domain-containing protein n=1 Tax=Desulfogranum japonicum TaxID=231447 RepID=UPI001294677C